MPGSLLASRLYIRLSAGLDRSLGGGILQSSLFNFPWPDRLSGGVHINRQLKIEGRLIMVISPERNSNSNAPVDDCAHDFTGKFAHASIGWRDAGCPRL